MLYTTSRRPPIASPTLMSCPDAYGESIGDFVQTKRYVRVAEAVLVRAIDDCAHMIDHESGCRAQHSWVSDGWREVLYIPHF
ncbi:hypothetical protein K491DRAFT_692678 [Lophiostoma macrostomum CBS 122681]|uniref:Uncharacterized protein n=1 Tax=Lophiostoma macrostomum CBS 122681 TaxID=1314788 RepID=A0A6A6T926_9PLEO|nr:hypothetical protein K491DRAFT_692678 [Lophiostoma macrostomum CBS 122681]